MSSKAKYEENKVPRRERYVTNCGINEPCRVARPMLRSCIVLKLLTGLRRGDLLRLRISDLRDYGIHVLTSMTKKQLVILWTDELAKAVEDAIASRAAVKSNWLFSTRVGNCYPKVDGSANGFDSLWQRFMNKALLETALVDRFQENDLRKKTASDMTTAAARALLGHLSESTTIKHYRLGAEQVTPQSLKKR